MASARAQLEELKKPNPRYVLELHSIRSMIKEADNMDKGLKIVLGTRLQSSLVPSGDHLSGVSQPPQRPLPVGISPQSTQPTTLASTPGDELASSPKREIFDLEDLFDDEIRIAMDKLII